MNGVSMRCAGVTAGLALSFFASASAQPPDVRALVASASAYVGRFYRDFGSMVAEERYEQDVRQLLGATTRSGRGAVGPAHTVLVSDFLLVQVPGEGWLPFRDVFERDGKRLRDREERLATLFLDGAGSRSAFEQARQIMQEGARYNIGNIERTINLPTLPLVFLTAAHLTRFDFETGKRDDDGVTEVAFTEKTRPTYVRTTGGRDLPVTGRFWVDPQTGTIRRTELRAIDTSVEAHIVVTYQLDAGTGMWVPARMEERYKRQRDSNEVRGVATYSKFRRFQVSTSEEVAK